MGLFCAIRLIKIVLQGVGYEPWHYRYVGKEHAKKINELGVCLEEYVK